VKGNGTRKFAMFSDADCPFCKRIENDIKRLDDVTIYTFLFPIDQLHPDAARKSAMIWCAPDRAKAWDAFFEAGTLPDNKGDCATPIKDTALLGNRLRVSATPTLVFADGSMVPGALPLAQLEIEINRGEVEAKKLAAKK
jgi:thiol:disulfide interchange protein DsbC